MSHSNRSRSGSAVAEPIVTDAALADAQAATIEAARVAQDAADAAHAKALGNAINAKLADAGDAIVKLVFDFETARVRALAIVRALLSGDAPTTQVGELDALAAALEAAAPPPPVHEDTCQTFSFARIKASFDEHGGSAELWADMSSNIPSACNCKASKPRRAATAANPRSTPVSTLPAGVLPIKWTKLDGTVVDMRYSDAARAAASDYPAAVACAKYVRGVDGVGGPKQSLNAQIPLRADAKAGNIPAIAIRFMTDPAPEVETPSV